ncbi:peptide/nickel transport system ATP-binding protein [Georgenia satyanarayanai]|uniref:Peptide/nickel transport system ATP-binding protein n=1 Tax=Georgenia satyanarayanai TaxID=860221 RepID=A0A2Y9A6L3_9MICO|nr:ABC transporter ATP-binding protein [Georgenia satyanarayanai]PYG00071.1 peptide/nickel transport system ATP-binding protein [Georgenia satyanarayanai]SSA40094.1 peptide/nickel transport system ATP-binding protein [Georgenia satyanarayanai]
MSLLDVRDLSVTYRTRRGEQHTAVDGVNLTVAPGEVVAVVGETGSGKTTTAHAVLGLLAPGATVTSGQILLHGTDIRGWSDKRLQDVRGRRIGLVPQDPGSSLDPLRTVGWQVAETLRVHGERDEDALRARVAELLDRVGLPGPRVAGAYPHELSGGMRQRVLIAAALALRPELLIADEPTSALDVTVQRRILDLLDELRTQDGTGVLLVTHDLAAAAAERADRIVVMQGGRVVDSGPASEVVGAPRSDYTRRLVRDAPALNPAPLRPVPPVPPPGAVPAIELRSVRKDFTGRGGQHVRAVDDVSLTVPSGTTHAVVGESGSGKSTTARILLGLETATAGTAQVHGTDVASLRGEARRQWRRQVQLVHQNPFGSLNPRMTVLDIVAEPLRNFRLGDRRERRARAAALLERVALGPQLHGRRPRELSGGQRQRVAIARALVLDPGVVVLDEPVSALDVSVQAQILGLLAELQRERGLTYLFISHDLGVVRQVSDTVTVMQHGRVVESGTTAEIFHGPRTEYTRELLDAVPTAHATRREP